MKILGVQVVKLQKFSKLVNMYIVSWCSTCITDCIYWYTIITIIIGLMQKLPSGIPEMVKPSNAKVDVERLKEDIPL